MFVVAAGSRTLGGVVRAGRQLSLVTTLDLRLLLAISRQLLEVSALPIAPGPRTPRRSDRVRYGHDQESVPGP
jgi:hypothetical protein